MTRRRIGIMGGSFNPVHLGHLVAADEALHAFALDQVLFVPAGRPWQKEDIPVAPAQDRYLMCLVATASHPAFSVSRLELDLQGPTYTVDTLGILGEQLGDVDLYFITGADAVMDILSWKDPAEVLRRARFIACTRPGYDLTQLSKALPPGMEDRVEIMEIPALAISSTDIRLRVKTGRSIRYLVPDAVAAMIDKAGLYR